MEKIKITLGDHSFEVAKEEYQNAVEKGSLEINSQGYKIFDNEVLEQREKAISQKAYGDGKDAGLEMGMKDFKKEKGLDFEGKSLDSLFSFATEQASASAKVEPNERYDLLNEKFKSLQSNYDNKVSEFDSYKKQIEEKTAQQKKQNSLFSMMSDDVIVDKDVALYGLEKKGFGAEFNDNGVLVILENGKRKQDDALNDVPVTQDYMSALLKQNNYITTKKSSSSGNGDALGNPTGGYKAFKAMAEKEGWSAEKTSEELNNRINNNEIDMSK